MSYILADVLLRDEELRSKIIVYNDLAVLHRQRTYTSKHQVLGNLVGKSPHGYKENVRSS